MNTLVPVSWTYVLASRQTVKREEKQHEGKKNKKERKGSLEKWKVDQALARWLSWLGHTPKGCGFNPPLGCIWRQPIDVSHIDVSLSLSSQ